MDGAKAAVSLKSGAPIKHRGTQLIPAGHHLIIELSG
jgi:hypothetical protein